MATQSVSPELSDLSIMLTQGVMACLIVIQLLYVTLLFSTYN